MKEIYRELKKIFDKYGAVCIGIALIIFIMLGTSYFLVCGVVALFAWVLNISYNWAVATSIWWILFIILRIIKKRTEEEIENT